jgi:hypothetical protein
MSKQKTDGRENTLKYKLTFCTVASYGTLDLKSKMLEYRTKLKVLASLSIYILYIGDLLGSPLAAAKASHET